jgi:hypothetical protein
MKGIFISLKSHQRDWIDAFKQNRCFLNRIKDFVRRGKAPAKSRHPESKRKIEHQRAMPTRTHSHTATVKATKTQSIQMDSNFSTMHPNHNPNGQCNRFMPPRYRSQDATNDVNREGNPIVDSQYHATKGRIVPVADIATGQTTSIHIESD